ncbi:MAG: hypothetical protein EXR07_21400 [Acetobacteraceae bacterium]|nr:hypothetical protein [Acetobacteraceae bacterium]
MALQVTLLLTSGDPDPTWTLTDEREQAFRDMLAAAPVPHTTLSGAYQATGYRGVMVRDRNDERWIVYRKWIRGGVVTRVDDDRAMELWLLRTGQGTVDPRVLSDLIRRVAPAA